MLFSDYTHFIATPTSWPDQSKFACYSPGKYSQHSWSHLIALVQLLAEYMHLHCHFSLGSSFTLLLKLWNTCWYLAGLLVTMEDFFLLIEGLMTDWVEGGREQFSLLAECGTSFSVAPVASFADSVVLASTLAAAAGSCDEPRRNLLICSCYCTYTHSTDTHTNTLITHIHTSHTTHAYTRTQHRNLTQTHTLHTRTHNMIYDTHTHTTYHTISHSTHLHTHTHTYNIHTTYTAHISHTQHTYHTQIDTKHTSKIKHTDMHIQIPHTYHYTTPMRIFCLWFCNN